MKLLTVFLGILLSAGGAYTQDKRNAQVDKQKEIERRMQPPDSAWVKGDASKAFLVAYEFFKIERDNPSNKRRLENYDVFLNEEGDNYVVTFSVKRSAGEWEYFGSPELKLG